MGFISDLIDRTKAFPGRDQGESLWRQVFGEDKEDTRRLVRPPTPGGSWGRSNIAGSAAYKRLLQAMRSMAPGGWSDDRWEQSKHYVGITYVASHRTGEQMAQAEFNVFQKDEHAPKGKIPVKKGHPGYKLVELLEKPNNDDSFGDWLYRINQQMDLTGMGLTWMVPNKLGIPFELYSIPTAIAIPQPAINPEFPDGYYRIQPIYPYGPFSSYPTPSTAVGAPIPAEWMMRFKFPHPFLRYDGYAPLTALRLHLDEIESMDRSRWYSMKRVLNPSGVLNFEESEGMDPLPTEEIERIRTEFENEWQGAENTGRLFVATPGAKLEPWGAPPRDMEYHQGWDQLVSFVLAGMGITKPAAGMVEDSSYSTLFATLKQFHLLTLQPKCVSGETPLITRDGAGPISQFEGSAVEIWNGRKWSNVVVKKTGENETLVRVRFSDGSYLDCTPNHRFSVSTEEDRVWRMVEAKDLCHGMATESFTMQYNEGKDLINAYTVGVVFGDGRIKNGKAVVDLFGDKTKLPVVGTRHYWKWSGVCKRPYVFVDCGEEFSKLVVDLRADSETAWWSLFSLNRMAILQFLAGWFDTDGNNGDSRSSNRGVRLCVSGRFRANMVQLLLTKCGIRSTIGLMARAGEITNYGRRSADLWFVYVADCKELPCYRLDVCYGHKPSRKGKFQAVKSVEYLPGIHDVYCFTEFDEHKGVFNNTLTHQCARISAGLTRYLAPFFGDNLIVEIRCQRIDDHDVRNAKLTLLMNAKAITKNELRRELDMSITKKEWDEEIAGADSQEEQTEEQGLAGLMGGANPLEGNQQEEKPEPSEITNTRPTPGKLGEGALGPRKGLERNIKAIVNGFVKA